MLKLSLLASEGGWFGGELTALTANPNLQLPETRCFGFGYRWCKIKHLILKTMAFRNTHPPDRLYASKLLQGTRVNLVV